MSKKNRYIIKFSSTLNKNNNNKLQRMHGTRKCTIKVIRAQKDNHLIISLTCRSQSSNVYGVSLWGGGLRDRGQELNRIPGAVE